MTGTSPISGAILRGDAFPWIVLLAWTAVLYGPVTGLWWTYDDPVILRQALSHPPWEYLFVPQAWQELSRYNFTPLLTLSFDADVRLFGPEPRWFYFHHLAVLWLCGCLFYRVLSSRTSRSFGLAGALILLAGSPVALSSQQLMVRHYIEGLLWALVSVLFFHRAVREGRRRWAILSALSFLAAILSKEVYIPLILLLPLSEAGSLTPRLRPLVPHLAVLALYAVWRSSMLGAPGGAFVETRLGGIAEALPRIPLTMGSLLFGPGAALQVIMAAAVLLPVTLYLLSDRKRALLASVAVLAALIPLAPIAQAVTHRHALVLWVLACAAVAGAAHRFWHSGRTLRALSVIVLSVTLVITVLQGRKTWSDHAGVAARMSVEGRFFLNAAPGDLLRLPSAPTWYFEGLQWLRQHGKAPPSGSSARWFADDIYLCDNEVSGRGVWVYEAAGGKMVNIHDEVHRIRSAYCPTVRSDAPLSLSVTYSPSTVSWTFGPYREGRYAFLMAGESVLFEAPPAGALPRPREGDVKFRIRYESPEGWRTYSDHLVLPRGREDGSLRWERQ